MAENKKVMEEEAVDTNKSRTKRSYIHNECNKQL